VLVTLKPLFDHSSHLPSMFDLVIYTVRTTCQQGGDE